VQGELRWRSVPVLLPARPSPSTPPKGPEPENATQTEKKRNRNNPAVPRHPIIAHQRRETTAQLDVLIAQEQQ
jgi:hypothetical protein